MNAYQLFTSALRSLRNHKVRSLLTTLGIIIGVVSIITVMSIGEGAKVRVTQTIEKIGSNFILVIGASPKHVGQRGGAALTIKPSDFEAVKSECEDIAYISPGLMMPNKVISEGANWQTIVGGVNQEYPFIRNWKLEVGEFFTEQDVKASTKVAVLGLTAAKELFGKENPINKIIRIKKLPFKVIGVVPEQGKSPDGRDQDDIIFIPVTTAQHKLLGKNNYGAMILSTKTKDRMATTADQIRFILREKHKLAPTDDDDFTFFTQDDILQATNAASQVMTLLLLIIASIALIVGGIGIMNIMLVSVTERTKEIGIRMALGATTETILTQFILEAITICLTGGLVGTFLGISVAKLIGYVLEWPIFISKTSLIISLGSSAIIGLFFGYYPAYKASQLNPVDALADR